MSNIYSRYPWIVILIIIFMSLVSTSVIYYSFYLGHKMTAKYSVLVDATMEAKVEITNAHLWLEEIIGGDESVTSLQIKKSFNQAQWYLNAMLYGNENSEGLFLPISPDNTQMTLDITRALSLVDTLQIEADRRLKNMILHKIGSDADIKYDQLHLKTYLHIDSIETRLQNIIQEELERYILIRNILFITIILINIFVLLSYKTILKFEKEWLLKYFKVEDEKDKLQTLYKELQEAQGLVNNYIPISQTDLAGNITYVNEAMCKLTKYSKNELIGKNHRILRYPKEEVSQYKEMWETISNGKVWKGEIKNLTKYANVYWTKIHIHPILNKTNEIIGYKALREDITNKKELEYLSSHDKLTSILNREKFDTLLEYELEQYSRYENTFSLAIFDLDFFKKVNDTYGHQIGDQILIQSVKVIQKTIRESDVLARWGGEEFVLLLPHTHQHEAKTVCEKIRKSIEETEFTDIGHITVSCGVSTVINEDSASSFFKRIDDALYKAKNNGRNKVEIL